MSPVSRGRKKAKSRSESRILRSVPAVPDACDCPECSNDELDPAILIDEMTAAGAELLEIADPLEAEVSAAGLRALGELAGEGFDEALSQAIVPALEESADSSALTILLALGAVGNDAAAAAAERLTGADVTPPPWAAELSAPLTGGVSRRYPTGGGVASIMVCTFERAGRTHCFIVNVDHHDCHAAADILLIPHAAVPEVLDGLAAQMRQAVPRITAEDLDPAEFRWQIERALNARRVHDDEDGRLGTLDEATSEDDEIGYHPLAMLLRRRMRALPEPVRPPASHGDDLSMLEMLTQLSGQAEQLGAGRRGGGRRGVGLPGTGGRKLPAKRKKSDGSAPIYQIKVSLRGAKPPIWRRLELPGDTGLARLHEIIQMAFGWDDSHMHVFETPYGDFGVADPELGYRAEKPVTLEQVAGAGEKVKYLYDFGDGWEHEILVEKLLDRQDAGYPRCTGGRRAGPPEDCGGVWGYADLVEILGDPSHPEHKERLEWLGLDLAADFDPAHFDLKEVNELLNP